MEIKEIPNKNNICIKKFNFSCDDIDPTIPKPLPQRLNFCMGIIGKAGSGKTTLLLNLVVKKGKVFKNKANAKKRIRSKSNFNKTNQSALNH